MRRNLVPLLNLLLTFSSSHATIIPAGTAKSNKGRIVFMDEEIIVENTEPSDTDRLVAVLERISETLQAIYLRINQAAPGEPKLSLIDIIRGGE